MSVHRFQSVGTADSPVYDLLHRRAKIKAEFERQSAELDKEEVRIHALLFDLVPDDLKPWVVEQDLVNVILKSGSYHSYIWFGGYIRFENCADVRRHMHRLGQVWRKYVHIDVSRYEEIHRVAIHFEVIL